MAKKWVHHLQLWIGLEATHDGPSMANDTLVIPLWFARQEVMERLSTGVSEWKRLVPKPGRSFFGGTRRP